MAALPSDIVLLLGSTLQRSSGSGQHSDRLRMEMCCKAWAAALKQLPFPSLVLSHKNVAWVYGRCPVVLELIVDPEGMVLDDLRGALATVTTSSGAALRSARWCSSPQGPCITPFPSWAAESLSSLQSLWLKLDHLDVLPPKALLPLCKLRHLWLSNMPGLHGCYNQEYQEDEASTLTVELPFSLQSAFIEAGGSLDVNVCVCGCLQTLSLRADYDINLTVQPRWCAGRIRKWVEWAAQECFPLLRRLALTSRWDSVTVTPDLNLDKMPLLERLELQSFCNLPLHASRPACHLTHLRLQAPAPAPLASIGQHLGALEALELHCWGEGSDSGLLHVCVDPMPSLRRLTVGSEQHCEVLATRPAPALSELRVEVGDLSASYACLPALRRLAFEETLSFVAFPMEGLPATLTSLECDYSALPPPEEPVWGGLRSLRLTGLPGSLSKDQLPQALRVGTRLSRLELLGRGFDGYDDDRSTLTPHDLRLLAGMASLRTLAADLNTVCVCGRCGGHMGCRDFVADEVLPGVNFQGDFVYDSAEHYVRPSEYFALNQQAAAAAGIPKPRSGH